uniref:Uncharacterized protein LOC113795379 n=1 Tax=Dermatophagoides pteronyssinus TaxID=6956 RepID=A0A6P6Y9W7_DERPT|nr:uncharacterized protein LOC113795379 [Dermatophagoides pteronyssinus]
MSLVHTFELLSQLRQSLESLQQSKRLVFVLIGAPGCGKGTHAQWLSKEFNMLHLSTGEALRQEIAKGTPLGVRLKASMEAGQLVSEEAICNIVSNFIEQNRGPQGYIFDGFPRSIRQAETLEKALAKHGERVSAVLFFSANDQTIMSRLSGRRIHLPSGRTYHVTGKPPKVPGKDDVTGEDLVQRSDDCAEAIKQRLETYKRETQPLINFYRERKLLLTLNGNEEYPTVHRDIKELYALAKTMQRVEHPDN